MRQKEAMTLMLLVLPAKHKVIHNIMVQEVTQLRMEVRLLIKKFAMINFKKVNTVGLQHKASRSYDTNLKEESKYLYRDWKVFETKGNESKVETTMRIGKKIRAEIEMVIEDTRMIPKIRVVHMFHQEVVTLGQ